MMKVKHLYSVLLLLLLVIGFTACSSDDATTECVTESFTMDDTIRPLCGIDEVPNHAVIEGLALNGGTFTLYVRTNADGSGGGEFTFNGTTLTATYKDGGASVPNTAGMTNSNWLIGFHQENPSVHVVVKQAADPNDLEDASVSLEVDSGEWTNTGSPATQRFYYKGTAPVTVTRVKIFHEEHAH